MHNLISLKLSIPKEGSAFLVNLDSPDSFCILSSVITYFYWNSLLNLIICVNNQHGISSNEHGFFYPNDAKEWGEELDGVQVFSPLGETVFGVNEFEAFMFRYFKFIRDKLFSSGKLKMGQDWNEFIKNLEELEKRFT
jgi:hypothetical protein